MYKILTLFFILITTANAEISLNENPNSGNFIYEQDTKALVTEVQVVFQSGSIDDPKGKEGLSSIAFESLLRGTKKNSKKDFFSKLETLGGSTSVDVSSNRAIISLSVLSDNLKPALELLSEAILSPSLKKEDINGLIQERIGSLNQELANNRSILKRAVRFSLYEGTSLETPPSGTLKSVPNIKVEDIKNFLDAHRKSENVIFAIATNHSKNDVKKVIEEVFGDFPEGKSPAHPKIDLPKITGRNLVVVEREGSSTTEMTISHMGILANDPIRDEIELGLFVFGEDMSSRLFQELRAKKGWTYGAYATQRLIEIPRSHSGIFSIYAFPQSEHTKDTVLRSIELYNEYVSKGLTAKELSFAKKSNGNAYPFKFASSSARLTSRLYQRLDGAPFLPTKEYRASLKKMNLKSIHKAIKKMHDNKNYIITLVGDPKQIEPLKKEIPELNSVRKIEDIMNP
ncbi:MAG: insulinase family protein [Oligoflexia bacterium]|nr:insulinase family protein [Oligoflexia bacterium]